MAAKEPNPLGLYDTSGNIQEMVWGKFHHGTDRGIKVDPGHVPVISATELIPARGGVFDSTNIFVCTRFRQATIALCHLPDPELPDDDCPNYTNSLIGFRLARTLPE